MSQSKWSKVPQPVADCQDESTVSILSQLAMLSGSQCPKRVTAPSDETSDKAEARPQPRASLKSSAEIRDDLEYLIKAGLDPSDVLSNKS